MEDLGMIRRSAVDQEQMSAGLAEIVEDHHALRRQHAILHQRPSLRLAIGKQNFAIERADVADGGLDRCITLAKIGQLSHELSSVARATSGGFLFGSWFQLFERVGLGGMIFRQDSLLVGEQLFLWRTAK